MCVVCARRVSESLLECQAFGLKSGLTRGDVRMHRCEAEGSALVTGGGFRSVEHMRNTQHL